MPDPAPNCATLDDWIARDAIPFATDRPAAIDAAIDKMMAKMDTAGGDQVELLGFGEALHGGKSFLELRNRIFQHLVAVHGFSAIAIESSFPRGREVNEYVAGGGPANYEAIQESGFSHGFGKVDVNRELVEWMRHYNADPAHRIKLRFYGFDSPTEMTHSDSPRHLLRVALDYFESLDGAGGRVRRERIEALLGHDADWENPAANFDSSKSIGLSPNAMALRIEVEDLITELLVRRPELVASSDRERYLDAVQHAWVARMLLNYHAGVAGTSNKRLVELLGIRDLIMADNLAHMVQRERGRGRVFAFAHNSHLQRGMARWQLGPQALEWWPAGTQLNETLGARYAVIGTGVGTSDTIGIGQPEAGSLEARLTATRGPARLIPTHYGQGLPAAEIAKLPKRAGTMTNPSYFPFSAQTLTDFDWLLVLDSLI